MDDKHFDGLARLVAQGASRRSVLKAFLGLGGAALAESVVLDGHSNAARRPTPTPQPVTCPGNQVPIGGACVCPPTAPNKCGPDCCTGLTSDPFPRPPGHSECCDNACCFGTCYGEELCCPAAQVFCDVTQTCCAPGEACCDDGCCAGFCYSPAANGVTTCCPEGNFVCADPTHELCCPVATDSCCVSNGVAACLSGDECCFDGDCPDTACLTQSCNQQTHQCEIDSIIACLACLVCDPELGCIPETCPDGQCCNPNSGDCIVDGCGLCTTGNGPCGSLCLFDCRNGGAELCCDEGMVCVQSNGNCGEQICFGPSAQCTSDDECCSNNCTDDGCCDECQTICFGPTTPCNADGDCCSNDCADDGCCDGCQTLCFGPTTPCASDSQCCSNDCAGDGCCDGCL